MNVQKMSLTEKDKKEMEEQIMEDESRRTVKLTVKALACKIEKVQKDRSSCVAKMKELTKEVKGLMKNDGNENDVQSAMGKLNNVYENAKGAHDSLIELYGFQNKKCMVFKSHKTPFRLHGRCGTVV